jgi:hypothetical protein
MELSLETKTRVEAALDKRGEFPVTLLQIVDIEADKVEELNEQSPIADEMLAAEEQQ